MDGAGRIAVNPEGVPAVGPFSHAIHHGSLLFCSGTLGIDPSDGKLVTSSLGAETAQALKNLEVVCREGGTELSKAVSLMIYTTRIDRFTEINDAYAAFFTDPFPARATVGVADLHLGASVEITAVVAVP